MMTVWMLDYVDYPESGGGLGYEAYVSEEVAVAVLKARYPSPPNKVRWSESRDDTGLLTVTGDFYEHVQHHHTKHEAEYRVVPIDVVEGPGDAKGAAE